MAWRWVLFIIMILHACIHLIGIARTYLFTLQSNTEGKRVQKDRYTIIANSMWLLAALIFIMSAFMFIMHRSNWWVVLIIGITLSQTLISINWKEAKAGTVINMALLLLFFNNFAVWRFDQKVQGDISVLINSANNTVTTTKTNIDSVPYCVRSWIVRSGALNKGILKVVRLEQSGYLRTAKDGKWMPSIAEQYFAITDPAFVWKVKTRMNSIVNFTGRDKLYKGKGNMLIDLYGIFPIVNESGASIDQGTLLRFLGEMCWFPSAALEPYIKWESITSHSAKATISQGNISCSGVFTFNDNSDVISFEAMRYMDEKGKSSLQKWYIPMTRWKIMDGVKVPINGEVTWKLSSGDFTYYKWNIIDVLYY